MFTWTGLTLQVDALIGLLWRAGNLRDGGMEGTQCLTGEGEEGRSHHLGELLASHPHTRWTWND